MILLFFSFLCYDFINCDEFLEAKFNKSPIENHHRNIRHVSAVFKDVKHRRHVERPVSRVFDHEQNQEFMDYSITEWWWNSTPGIDQTDRNTPQISVLLSTPIGHGKFPGDIYPSRPYNPLPEPTEPIEVQDDFSLPPPGYTFKDHDLPPSITRPSFPFPIETPSSPGTIPEGPPYTAYYPEPIHPQFPGLTPPPGFPSDYRYPTVYPPSPGEPYVPSPTGPTPKRPSFSLLPDVDRPVLTYPKPTYTPIPSVYPPGSDPDLYSFIPQPTSPSTFLFSFTTLNPSIGEYVNVWLQEMANSTVNKWLKYGWTIMPKHHEMIDYTSTTERLPPPIELAHTNVWNHNMQLKNNDLKDQPRPIQRQVFTVFNDETEVKKPKLLPITTIKLRKDFNYDYDNTTTPNKDAKTTDGKPVKASNDTNENLLKPSTARDVIHNYKKCSEQVLIASFFPEMKIPKYFKVTTASSYYKMIEVLDEGYLMVFLIELTRLVVMKDKTEVYEVISHADSIINRFYETGQMLWLGQPFIHVTRKMAKLLLETDTGIIQSHAAITHHMLKTRKNSLSMEVNIILEYAEMLYNDAEGKLLFGVLKDFANYPNITLTGYWLCDSLIKNFLRPYRRLGHKQRLQRLLDSINLALISRFPELKITLRQTKDETLRPATEIQQNRESKEKKIITQKEYHRDTPSNLSRERKSKRHIRIRKQNRDRKRRRKHRYRPQFATGNIYYRRQYSQGVDYEYPILRSMKPITSVQKRFRVVTSKYHLRTTKRRTRSAFFLNLMTRPTRSSSYGGRNRDPRYQTNTPFPLFHENFDRPNYKRHIPPTDEARRYSSTVKTLRKDKTVFYHQVGDLFTDAESQEKTERPNLKSELLRGIVDGSNEDEELMNLIETLQNGKRTLNITDDNKSN